MGGKEEKEEEEAESKQRNMDRDRKREAEGNKGTAGESKHAGSSDNSVQPKVEVTAIEIGPRASAASGRTEITDPLELKIKFDLDRDVVAAYWVVKLLVDSCDKRVIKILGETPVEDYPDGDSEMYFSVESIDVSDIPPSVLANYGLLSACFMADGEEVAAINMVVNVTQENGKIMREILSPLE